MAELADSSLGGSLGGLVDWFENMERKYNISLGAQTVTMSYGGWKLAVTLYLGSLAKTTKHIVNVTLAGKLSGVDFSNSIDLKLKEKNEGYSPIITDKFSLKGKDWVLKGTVDPKMTYHDYIVHVEGDVKGVGVLVDIPKIVEYRETDISLADVPGLGTVLSSIPFVIPGTTVSIDAGLDLKYGVPIDSGVLINEVEANP